MASSSSSSNPVAAGAPAGAAGAAASEVANDGPVQGIAGKGGLWRMTGGVKCIGWSCERCCARMTSKKHRWTMRFTLKEGGCFENRARLAHGCFLFWLDKQKHAVPIPDTGFSFSLLLGFREKQVRLSWRTRLSPGEAYLLSTPFSSSASVLAASFSRVCDHVHPPPVGRIHPLRSIGWYLSVDMYGKKDLSLPPGRVVGFPSPRPALFPHLTLCVGIPIAPLLRPREGSTGEGEQETEAARVERKRKKKRRRAERAAEAAAGAAGGASAGPNSSRVAGAAAKAVKKNKESSAVYASLFGTKKVSNEHLFIATAGHRYNLG